MALFRGGEVLINKLYLEHIQVSFIQASFQEIGGFTITIMSLKILQWEILGFNLTLKACLFIVL